MSEYRDDILFSVSNQCNMSGSRLHPMPTPADGPSRLSLDGQQDTVGTKQKPVHEDNDGDESRAL